MTTEDQLAYERQARMRMTVVAAAAGILLLLGTVVSLAGPHAKVDELTLGLIIDHKRGALNIISAGCSSLGELCIAWTLVYLFRCAKARAPEARRFIPWIALTGGVLAAVTGVLDPIILMFKVSDFVHSGQQTYDEATRLTGGAGLLVIQIVSQLAALIVAIGWVLVSLQAMRVGLLPRFLGYVGMLAGALMLFPLIAVPVVQLYWLLAVAALIYGFWPSGLPKAWTSGNAEAWPSSNEMRARRAEQAAAARERRQASRKGGAKPAKGIRGPAAAASSDEDSVTAEAVSAASGAGAAAKRKRKRKR